MIYRILLSAFLSGVLGCGSLQAQSVFRAKPGPAIEGCAVFPPNNIWNVPVDNLPVSSKSDTYVETIGRNNNLHPDFGSGVWPPETGGPIGIPFVTVDSQQEEVPLTFRWPAESDPGPYPIPPDAPIEGGSSSTGDRHVIVLDTSDCFLYELYKAYPQNGGASWQADSGAVFDLTSNDLRPDGWTSADAAGLPILPGLVRYEEVATGEIRHAVRFTAPETQRAYVWPARHFASHLTGSQYPPLGQRFRLKNEFDSSGFHPDVQVILRALKKYGMILADNGSPWYISGAPDGRWDNEVLAQLKTLKGSDFEAVSVFSLIVAPDSGEADVAESQTILFPHLANGVGQSMTFRSEIVLVNGGDPTSILVEFFNTQGLPWSVQLDGYGLYSELDYVLGRGQHLVLQTAGENAIEVGYARVSAGVSVSGTAILRGTDAPTQTVLFEAGIPSADLYSDFSVYLDSVGNKDTGIALLNPPTDDGTEGSPATVSLRLYDASYELIGEDSAELFSGEYRPRFIYELFSDPGVAEIAREMRGVLTVSSDMPLAALTLRQGEDPTVDFPSEVPTLTVFPVIAGRPDASTPSLDQ